MNATLYQLKWDFDCYILWLFRFRISRIEIGFGSMTQSFIAIRFCRWEVWFSKVGRISP